MGQSSSAVMAGGVIVVLVVLFLAWLFSRYRKVGPNEALVVFGMGRQKIVVSGGVFVYPAVHEVRRMSMEIMTIDVATAEVYTDQGVPVTVDGVAQVKVGETEEMIKTAAGQFLTKTLQEIRNIALQTLEGHLRAILGTMTVEMIYRQRDEFSQRVQEVAAQDLAGMGLRIVSFTIREIRDSHGYLDALGKSRIAQVRRDAIIGERTADREARAQAALQEQEARIAEAEADKNARQAQATADADAKETERDRNIRAANYQAQEQEAKAQADIAYPLSQAKKQQELEKEKIQVEVVQKEMQTQVQLREIERKQRDLDASVRKPAEAEQFRIETMASAERQRRVAEAEGEASALQQIGVGRAAGAKAEGLATAEVQKAQGLAQAEVIRQKGFAEAEAMMKKADAWQNYNQAAITEKVVEVLPAIAEAIAKPLAQTEKIIMVNTGGDGGVGVSKLTGDIANVVSQLPPVVEALSGINFEELLSRLPVIGSHPTPPPTAPPPPAAAPGS